MESSSAFGDNLAKLFSHMKAHKHLVVWMEVGLFLFFNELLLNCLFSKCEERRKQHTKKKT